MMPTISGLTTAPDPIVNGQHELAVGFRAVGFRVTGIGRALEPADAFSGDGVLSWRGQPGDLGPTGAPS
jgi:hypothetical protein